MPSFGGGGNFGGGGGGSMSCSGDLTNEKCIVTPSRKKVSLGRMGVAHTVLQSGAEIRMELELSGCKYTLNRSP